MNKECISSLFISLVKIKMISNKKSKICLNIKISKSVNFSYYCLSYLNFQMVFYLLFRIGIKNEVIEIEESRLDRPIEDQRNYGSIS